MGVERQIPEDDWTAKIFPFEEPKVQEQKPDSYAGACWNALMEEETKESIARMFIDGLRENRDLRKRIADLAAEVGRLKAANEMDRRSLWATVRAIDEEITGRMWLLEGRGSYEWDDDKYRQEFGWAVHALQEKLEPLRKIAHDLTNCPENEKGVDSVRKMEAENETLKGLLREYRLSEGKHLFCSNDPEGDDRCNLCRRTDQQLQPKGEQG